MSKNDLRSTLEAWQAEARAKEEASLAALARESRRSTGFASAEIAPTICRGAVFEVDDLVINLPDSRIGTLPRREHPKRRVVVLSPSTLCADPGLAVVQVAPCSGHPPNSAAHRLDYQLPTASEPGFTLAARIYVSLAQPVLKADFTSRQKGVVNQQTLIHLLARWAAMHTG